MKQIWLIFIKQKESWRKKKGNKEQQCYRYVCVSSQPLVCWTMCRNAGSLNRRIIEVGKDP